MGFNKMSDQELYNLYEAMKSGQENTVFSELCKAYGMSVTILNICMAISDRWYKNQKAKKLRPQLGDEIWYLEFKYESPEYGHVYRIFYDEDGDIISIDVIFSDTNNIRTFYGFDIGKCLFRTKEDAQIYFAQDHDQ